MTRPSSTRPDDSASVQPTRILAINGGSSSIRFALYDGGDSLRPRLNGKLDRIGSADSMRSDDSSGTTLTCEDATGTALPGLPTAVDIPASPADWLLDWLEGQQDFAELRAVGHRVVHGMLHSEPQRITPALLDELRGLVTYDPDHLPLEIELIDAFLGRYPNLPQVACFDTAFHRNMPRVARMLPIPRRYEALGVRRYGFHGLSYTYLMEELARIGDPAASSGRVILAHLGSGASLAAVRDGRCIDTSMGFTPTSGLMMGTRTGDLDPGLVTWLARTEQMSTAQFQEMANHASGLLGVSGISADMRELLDRERHDEAAADAIALFCYQVRKWIGSYAAALGGVDTLVFAGGIGEHSPVVRERICAGLGFLGIELDPQLNADNRPMISRETGRVRVRMIRTDEQLMIARSAARVMESTLEV